MPMMLHGHDGLLLRRLAGCEGELARHVAGTNPGSSYGFCSSHWLIAMTMRGAESGIAVSVPETDSIVC